MYKSAICVKECPTLNVASNVAKNALKCKPIASMNIDCPTTYFKSANVWRTCVPHDSAFKSNTPGHIATKAFTNSTETAGSGANALKEFAWEMILSSCLAIIFNILFIYLMSR